MRTEQQPSLQQLEEKAIRDVADASKDISEYVGYPEVQIDIAIPTVDIPPQLDHRKITEAALRARTAEQPPTRPSIRTISRIVVGFDRPNGSPEKTSKESNGA